MLVVRGVEGTWVTLCKIKCVCGAWGRRYLGDFVRDKVCVCVCVWCVG